MNKASSLFILAILSGVVSAEQSEVDRQLEAHEHGLGQLNVALEKEQLHIEFISPSMNIVGFERAPATSEEQNAVQTLSIADHAYVMENGKIVLQGTGEELLEDAQIRTAYLGL